ncbi:MAG: carboxypeptidase-like regulatory domain-containing protein [Bryobacteraceae bacterium]
MGSIVDGAGVPQRGASVQLFNKYQQLVAKTASDSEGRFAFLAVPADLYSLHATLASFLPAAKDRISVKAGSSSILQIHLATLFSSIEVNYVVPTSAMADDWKWVLRSSPATRPITRLVDESSEDSSSHRKAPVFTQTQAMLSLSGGDGGTFDSSAALGDWGTGFSLSTTVLGNSELKVSGSYGDMAAMGPPSVTICAIYSPHEDGYFGRPPELTLMMSQVGGVGSPVSAGPNASIEYPVLGSAPLRAMSLGMYETADPIDNVHIEYGALAESLDYLQHSSRISPFVRLTVNAARVGQFVGAYSDGGQPDALLRHNRNAENDLEARNLRDLISAGSLAKLPQLSRQNGRLEMQRTRTLEIGWNKVSGTRTYAFSAFTEDVSHGRINLAGDLSAIRAEDLLTDTYASTSTYNIGRYSRRGYWASAMQKVGGHADFSVGYGQMGGFAAHPSGPSSGQFRSFVDQKTVNIAAARVRTSLAVLGTQLQIEYGWMDGGRVVPQHLFTTQDSRVSPGFNVYLRQPLPSAFGLPGRLELTADLRNLLAQGYLPIASAGGSHTLIMQAPRSIRGGLNFIF